MSSFNKLILIVLTSSAFITLHAQEKLHIQDKNREISETRPFQILFYNTENLFDTQHDSLKNDYEFLPGQGRYWSYGRYKKKLQNIGKAIIATGGWLPPALVGLAEVENEKVLIDLTRYSLLKEANYRYVHHESPDERGIDVALLYQPSQFRLLSDSAYRIRFPENIVHKPTRDMLHVSGRIISGDTLDVFVVHLPSRSGGELQSRPARVFAAQCMKQWIDSIMSCRTSPQIIVMGDFNDSPVSASVIEGLQAQSPSRIDSIGVNSKTLYNLMLPIYETSKKKRKQEQGIYGTYKWQGEWEIIDQFLVNDALLQKGNADQSKRKGLYFTTPKAEIVQHNFLLEPDLKEFGVRPFRTYYGYKYQGGFSDHLPITIRGVIFLHDPK